MRMRVLTVTPHPAIDLGVYLDRALRPGDVQRATDAKRYAGGKGVNVASCLADWFGQKNAPAAFGLLGRDNAEAFEECFRQKGIDDRFVRVDGATRLNLKIVDPRDTTDINLPGPPATPEALARLEATLAEALRRPAPPADSWSPKAADATAMKTESVAATASTSPADNGDDTVWLVLSGGLPAGCPENWYARALQIAADAIKATEAGGNGPRVRVVLDASGAPLAHALDWAARAAGGGGRCGASSAASMPLFAVKPNRRELGEWAGRDLSGEADLLEAARRMLDAGPRWVAVSLGAEGALYLSRDGAWRTRIPETLPSGLGAAGTVGAGDAMVAGLVAALSEGASAERVARLSTAFALAKLTRAGPNLPARAQVEELAGMVAVEARVGETSH